MYVLYETIDKKGGALIPADAVDDLGNKLLLSGYFPVNPVDSDETSLLTTRMRFADWLLRPIARRFGLVEIAAVNRLSEDASPDKIVFHVTVGNSMERRSATAASESADKAFRAAVTLHQDRESLQAELESVEKRAQELRGLLR